MNILEDKAIRDAWLLPALLLLALAARIVYAFDYADTALYHFPIIDAGYHSFLARLGAEGAAIPGGPYFKPPLYIWFLTDLYSSVGGKSLAAAHVLNTLLGLGVVALTFVLGKRLLGRWPAFAAALFVALYDLGPFFEEQALAVTLVTFTYLLSLLLLIGAWDGELDWPRRRRRLIWAGVAMGFAILARPSLLLFLPVVAVLGLTYGLRDENFSFKRALAASLIPVALALLVVLPVTLRNLVESGEPVLVSANGGINFFIGNGPGADGFSSVPPGLAWRRLSGDSELAGAGGLADGSYWYARGLDAVLQSPGRAVGLFFKKALGFFNAADVSNNVDIGWARGQSLWLRLNPLRWWLVTPFGLAGLFTALGRNRKRLLRDENPGFKRGLTILTVFALTYYAGVIAFFVTSRYRMPMVPVLALLGAGFVSYLGKLITAKTKQLNFLPWVVLLVCLGLTLIPVVPVEDGFYGHFYAGLALEKRGLLSEALVEYNRTLEIRPDDPEAHQRRGAVRGRLDDQPGRREDLERAVELSPENADALYDLAMLILGTGSPDGSMPLFERAVEAEPDFVPARMAYGIGLLARGDFTESAAQFESAVELRPRFSAAHRLLGKTYSALGRAREAAEEIFFADYFGGEIWE